MDLPALIASLPKTDLHLHLVGSASVDTVVGLARRHPGNGVPTDRDSLVRFYEFTDFAHFVEVYYAVDSLITTPRDVTDLVVGLARDAARSNVRWAEVTVTADTHLRAGMSPADLCAALEDGRRAAATDHGVAIGWIFDIPGERGHQAAEATVAFLRHHAPDGTLALGLAGVEIGVPRPQFAPYFDAARALGLRSVVHAGESTGPETVWDALRTLHADRIGHGTSSVRDPELLRHLRDHAVPVEVCVSSNHRTAVIPEGDEHPVVRMLRDGLTVCLATDDPGMFGTDLNREYELVAGMASLGADDLAGLARAGFEASFAPADIREAALAELDALRPLPAPARERAR